ncbi:MAG: GntR family transcriptional regulator [Lacrimispora sp.]|uniref:GntR family transcriptional regulator n=1 Tax=Lacrimispora sp. TaxID=2719234 RepID=UPI0039E3B87D
MEVINKMQANEYTTDVLRKEILFNRFKDGDELVQEIVSKQLGVSRMPVREAFKVLELEGFLIRLPNRHVIVKGMTEKSIHEIFLFIYSIQTGFINRLISEKKEWYEDFQGLYSKFKNHEIAEVKLHSFFSQDLDNLYIHRLHNNLLEIYAAFVLDDLGASGAEELNIWDKVEKALYQKDREQINELFQTYFLYLGKVMTEKVLTK